MKKEIELGYVYPSYYNKETKKVPLYPSWYTESKLDPNSIIDELTPGLYKFNITYPLVEPFNLEINIQKKPTRQKFANLVAKIYNDIYDDPFHQTWGHSLEDLTISDIIINKRKGSIPKISLIVQS